MQKGLAAAVAMFAAAALVLTLIGARRTSIRMGLWGAACYALSITGALVMGMGADSILLYSLVLLCVSRVGGRSAA